MSTTASSSSGTASNPLLNLGFNVPFPAIRAEHLEPAFERLIAEAEDRMQKLIATKDTLTFDTVLDRFESMTERLDIAHRVVSHMENVASSPEFRKAFMKIDQAVTAFRTRVYLSPELWSVIERFSKSSEGRALTGVRRRYLERVELAFVLEGSRLNPTSKARLTEINDRLSELTNRFGENVLEATKRFELVITDPAQLAGLPENAVATARADAEAKGKEGWRFTLQTPSMSSVLMYLDDASIREKVYKAAFTRASDGALDNQPIIEEIVALRREKANLLGFETFADLITYDRMAKTGAQVREFLVRLKEKCMPAAKREAGELQQFRDQREGAGTKPMQPWDVAYYTEKLQRERYEYDAEALRPYFPLPKVMEGGFNLAHQLYGVTFREVSDLPVWHESVRTYAIYDTDGTHLGSFYADFLPRETKREGAWMDQLITGRPQGGAFEPHLGLICGNFSPPVPGRPTLLTHSEVEVLCHEFGHLLHGLLSRVEIRALSGTNVAWDFVELPSQIMENWCWHYDALTLFASHYETGEKLPRALFERLERLKTFRSATQMLRQVGMAALDLELHTTYDRAKDGPAFEYGRKFLEPFMPASLPKYYALLATFHHLFKSPVGYAAGYYSYHWAEVLDADAFSRFESEGLFNRTVGEAFREHILSQGDTLPADELFKKFMGREPDPDAMLRRAGVLS